MGKIFYSLIILVLGVCLGGFVALFVDGQSTPFGSIVESQEYTATSTPAASTGGAWTDQLLKNGRGGLGSVIITSAGTVEFILYDATSTGSLTTGNFDPQNRKLAYIEPSQVEGTYVFDVGFNYGLLLDVKTSGTGTSTITFR
jgi:hypothetical protein